jgi:hypothetical protein
MSSVVYVGRKSFRMEAVALEPELARELGIVQPIVSETGIVTAPLHAPSRRHREEAEDGGAPPLRSLFSSQVSIPLLAAPSVAVGNVGSPRVTLTRASLVTLGALVLLCGIVVGTAARHLLAAPKPLSVVAAPAVAAPAPSVVTRAMSVPAAPSAETSPPSPPPTPTAPAPVAIHEHVKTAPSAIRKRPTTVEAAAPTEETVPAPKAWVDPWAE